jgi:hypothetical protein
MATEDREMEQGRAKNKGESGRAVEGKEIEETRATKEREEDVVIAVVE